MAPPAAWLSGRHRLILVLFGLSLALLGGLAGLTIAALATGAQEAAAVLALATLLASPLLLLGPAQDWWRFRRGRRWRGGRAGANPDGV